MKTFLNGEIVDIENEFLSISEMDESFQKAHWEAVDKLINDYEKPCTSKDGE